MRSRAAHQPRGAPHLCAESVGVAQDVQHSRHADSAPTPRSKSGRRLTAERGSTSSISRSAAAWGAAKLDTCLQRCRNAGA